MSSVRLHHAQIAQTCALASGRMRDVPMQKVFENNCVTYSHLLYAKPSAISLRSSFKIDDDDETINSFSDNPFNSFHLANNAPSSLTGTVFKFLITFDSNADCVDCRLDWLTCFSDELSTIAKEDVPAFLPVAGRKYG